MEKVKTDVVSKKKRVNKNVETKDSVYFPGEYVNTPVLEKTTGEKSKKKDIGVLLSDDDKCCVTISPCEDCDNELSESDDDILTKEATELNNDISTDKLTRKLRNSGTGKSIYKFYCDPYGDLWTFTERDFNKETLLTPKWANNLLLNSITENDVDNLFRLHYSKAFVETIEYLVKKHIIEIDNLNEGYIKEYSNFLVNMSVVKNLIKYSNFQLNLKIIDKRYVGDNYKISKFRTLFRKIYNKYLSPNLYKSFEELKKYDLNISQILYLFEPSIDFKEKNNLVEISMTYTKNMGYSLSSPYKKSMIYDIIIKNYISKYNKLYLNKVENIHNKFEKFFNDNKEKYFKNVILCENHYGSSDTEMEKIYKNNIKKYGQMSMKDYGITIFSNYVIRLDCEDKNDAETISYILKLYNEFIDTNSELYKFIKNMCDISVTYPRFHMYDNGTVLAIEFIKNNSFLNVSNYIPLDKTFDKESVNNYIKKYLNGVFEEYDYYSIYHDTVIENGLNVLFKAHINSFKVYRDKFEELYSQDENVDDIAKEIFDLLLDVECIINNRDMSVDTDKRFFDFSYEKNGYNHIVPRFRDALESVKILLSFYDKTLKYDIISNRDGHTLTIYTVD